MAFSEFFSKQSIGLLEQILGYGVGGAVTPVVEWAARPIAYDLNAANPNLQLDPQTLALVQMRLEPGTFDGTQEAASSGMDADRYAKVFASLFSPPSNGEILELMRRQVLPLDVGKSALIRNGLAEEWIDQYVDLQRILLSPQDLAMARQQGFVTDDESRSRSLLQGVEAADADLLFEMSGLPPGADTAMQMLRRGIADEELFAQMIREGHTKTKYIPQLLELFYEPLSASVAAEALVRERMPQDEAVAIAAKNGIAEADFLQWVDILGRPIGIMEGITLLRRGDINDADFKEIVARSDVRTEYTDDLLKLKLNLPPLFQVSRMLANGSITDDKATEILLDEGYEADVVKGLIHSGHATKTSGTKHLAASQIDLLYESGLESRQWANDALIGLGYDADEAEWHLELLDAKRLMAALQSDLNLIHRLYVTHKIDEPTASTNLDQLQIRTDVRDTLLQQWTNERTENVTRLTNAQIGRALKDGFIQATDAISRWMNNGYSEDDAMILAELATGAQLGVSPTAS